MNNIIQRPIGSITTSSTFTPGLAFATVQQQFAPLTIEAPTVEQKDGTVILHGIRDPESPTKKTSATIRLLGLDRIGDDATIIYTIEYESMKGRENRVGVFAGGKNFDVQNVSFKISTKGYSNLGDLRLKFEYNSKTKKNELGLLIDYPVRSANGKTAWAKDPNRYILKSESITHPTYQEYDILQKFEKAFSCSLVSPTYDDYDSGKPKQPCSLRELKITKNDLERLNLPYKGLQIFGEDQNGSVSVGDYLQAAKEAGYIK